MSRIIDTETLTRVGEVVTALSKTHVDSDLMSPGIIALVREILAMEVDADDVAAGKSGIQNPESSYKNYGTTEKILDTLRSNGERVEMLTFTGRTMEYVLELKVANGELVVSGTKDLVRE